MMLFHKLSLGLTLILMVYVSAAPVVIEDTKKNTKKRGRVSLPRPRHTSKQKEPWEINEKIILVQGMNRDEVASLPDA